MRPVLNERVAEFTGQDVRVNSRSLLGQNTTFIRCRLDPRRNRQGQNIDNLNFISYFIAGR